MGVWDWKDKTVAKAIEKLFLQNLCVGKYDRVIIVSDCFKERMGELFFWFGTGFSSEITHVTYLPTGRHGLEPPQSVWIATFGDEFVEELKSKDLLRRVFEKQVSDADEEEIREILLETTSLQELPTVVIAVNQFSISHTLFRKLCSEFLSMRFASMPLFEPFMFYTAMQANWFRVERLSTTLAKLLTEATTVRVKNADGTDIEFSIRDREGLADTGRLCTPGSFGNLPAGEAFIAPVEGTAEGVFVTRYAPDRELSVPTRFEVEGGRVKSIQGDEKIVSFITDLIHKEKNADNIAEFGIGTNDRAVRRDNILEAEKILGTCHIAIGDNSAFGGKMRANVHIDFLVEAPTIELEIDGSWETVMEEGKLRTGGE